LSALQQCCTADDLVRLESSFPEIHGARQLQISGGNLRASVEARILAGQTDVEIAALTSLDPLVIAAFESLFFCVRDRLQAGDWIATVVIGPGLRCGFASDEMPLLLRAFGYYAGASILELVMAVTENRPLPVWVQPPPGVDRESFESRLRLSVRLVVALRMMQSSDDAAEVRRLYRAYRCMAQDCGTETADDQKIEVMLDFLANPQLMQSPRRADRCSSDARRKEASPRPSWPQSAYRSPKKEMAPARH